MVPHLVTPESPAIDKFIRGLPLCVQDAVIGTKDATLKEIIRLAGLVTDNHVLKGTLTRKGGKRSADKVSPDQTKETIVSNPPNENKASSSGKKKRKA